jgi:hypothetical protein
MTVGSAEGATGSVRPTATSAAARTKPATARERLTSGHAAIRCAAWGAGR